jgi:hypothetical protein
LTLSNRKAPFVRVDFEAESFFNIRGGDFMGSFGGYYKGDKKKPKKDKQGNQNFGSAPVFTMPELISKKKPA